MIALKLAISIFLFSITLWIFAGVFATVVLAMGPYWTIAVLVMGFGYHRYRLHERRLNQQRGLQFRTRRESRMKEIGR